MCSSFRVGASTIALLCFLCFSAWANPKILAVTMPENHCINPPETRKEGDPPYCTPPENKRSALIPSLPQKDQPQLSKIRHRLLNRERKQYDWTYDIESLAGIPILKSIPYEVQPNGRWRSAVLKSVAKTTANSVASGFSSSLAGSFEEAEIEQESAPTSFLEEVLADVVEVLTETGENHKNSKASRQLQHYDNLFSLISLPSVHKIFQSDQYFAELRLAGPNPMLITLARTIPEKLAVTETGFQQVMKRRIISRGPCR